MRSFLAGLALLAATTAAHAEVVQLITNGNFQNTGTFVVNENNSAFPVTALPGWTTTDPSNVFYLYGGNAFEGGFHTGNYSLNLAYGNPDSPYTYSQTGTVPLGSSVVSATFSFQTREYFSSPTIWQLSSSGQGVLLTGTQVNSFPNFLTVSNTLSAGQSAALQGGDTLTVSFRTPGPANANSAFIDNVSLSLVTVPVPEPSTLAGFGVVGIGLAAVIRRRLRAAKSAN